VDVAEKLTLQGLSVCLLSPRNESTVASGKACMQLNVTGQDLLLRRLERLSQEAPTEKQKLAWKQAALSVSQETTARTVQIASNINGASGAIRQPEQVSSSPTPPLPVAQKPTTGSPSSKLTVEECSLEVLLSAAKAQVLRAEGFASFGKASETESQQSLLATQLVEKLLRAKTNIFENLFSREV